MINLIWVKKKLIPFLLSNEWNISVLIKIVNNHHIQYVQIDS